MLRPLRDRGSRLLAALAGGLFLAFFLLGCVDDGDSTVPPTETAPSPTQTPRRGSALPLERFHYVASLTVQPQGTESEGERIVVSTEGDFESPNRHAFTYTIRRGENSVSRSMVLIARQVWFRQGNEPWSNTRRSDPRVIDLLASAFSPARPGFLGGEEYQQVRESVQRLPSKQDPVNDVAANHYRVTSAGSEFFVVFVADDPLLRDVQDLTWDLWLAEQGGWPVRLRASGTVTSNLKVLGDLDVQAPASWELRIDISRPNDPKLAVRAPQ